MWGGEGPKTGQTPPCQQQLSVLQVCKFLIHLSMDFSSYYNRVHVLGVSQMSRTCSLQPCSPSRGWTATVGQPWGAVGSAVPAAWCSLPPAPPGQAPG